MCAAAVKSLEVRVGDSASSLDSPYIPAVPGVDVDLKTLPPGDTSFEIFVPRGAGFTVGEEIFLFVAGSMASGELFSYVTQKPVAVLGRPLTFTVPAAILTYMANSKGDAFYRKGSATGALSQNYAFNVKGDAVVLPVPEVTETTNGALNPKVLKVSPDVLVKPWPNIAVGQQFWVTVDSITADGKSKVFKTVTGTVNAAQVTSGLKFDLPLKELQELAEGTALNISVSLTLGGGTDLVHALNFPVITVKLGSTLNDATDFKNGNMNGWEIPNRDIYNQNSPGRYATIVNIGGRWVFENKTPPLGRDQIALGQHYVGFVLQKYYEFVVGKSYVVTCQVRSITQDGLYEPFLDLRNRSANSVTIAAPPNGQWYIMTFNFVAQYVNDYIGVYSSRNTPDGNDYQITDIVVKEVV